MDMAKLNRRRVHERETTDDEHVQSKRRRKHDVEQDNSDSVLFVGESQVNIGVCRNNGNGGAFPSSKNILLNGSGNLGPHGDTVPHHNKAMHATPCDRDLDGDKSEDCLEAHTHVTFVLPPNLRESERMMHVQQWINNIPLNLTPCVQTSRLTIVPVTNLSRYPDEENLSDSQTSLTKDLDPLHPRAGECYAVRRQRCNGRFIIPPNVTNANDPAVFHGRPAPQMSANPVTRLFDSNETQLVVQIFRDHFTKGSCPNISEVRQRVSNSLLEGRRSAVSIRAKIRRLQTSGRWTDYSVT